MRFPSTLLSRDDGGVIPYKATESKRVTIPRAVADARPYKRPHKKSNRNDYSPSFRLLLLLLDHKRTAKHYASCFLLPSFPRCLTFKRQMKNGI